MWSFSESRHSPLGDPLSYIQRIPEFMQPIFLRNFNLTKNELWHIKATCLVTISRSYNWCVLRYDKDNHDFLHQSQNSFYTIGQKGQPLWGAGWSSFWMFWNILFSKDGRHIHIRYSFIMLMRMMISQLMYVFVIGKLSIWSKVYSSLYSKLVSDSQMHLWLDNL